jgi:hypothetical protein
VLFASYLPAGTYEYTYQIRTGLADTYTCYRPMSRKCIFQRYSAAAMAVCLRSVVKHTWPCIITKCPVIKHAGLLSDTLSSQAQFLLGRNSVCQSSGAIRLPNCSRRSPCWKSNSARFNEMLAVAGREASCTTCVRCLGVDTTLASPAPVFFRSNRNTSRANCREIVETCTRARRWFEGQRAPGTHPVVW